MNPPQTTAAHCRDDRPADDHALVRELLAKLQAGHDFRARKVRRLRAAIRVRAYENSLKLAVAADKLLGDVRVDSSLR